MFRRVFLIGSGAAVGAIALALVSLKVAALFGATRALDSYQIGVALPALLLSLSATVITALVTPRLTSAGALAGRKAGEWAVAALVLGIGAAALLAAIARPLILVVAPGSHAQTVAMSVHVLRIYSLTIPLTLVAFVFSAYGYANGRVWAAGASNTIYGAAWFCLLFTPTFSSSVNGVAWAALVATCAQVASAFIFCSSLRERPWPAWPKRARNWRIAGAAAGLMANVVLGRANLLLDPWAGSHLSAGAVARLTYAYRLVLVIVLVCGQGPALTALAGRPGARRGVTEIGTAAVFAAGVAATVGLAFRPIAVTLLAHGSFRSADANRVGLLIEAYAGFIFVNTVAWAAEAELYARGYVWRIVKLSVASLLVNAILSGLLIHRIGEFARPVAASVGAAIYMVLLLRLLGREDGLRWTTYVPARVVASVAACVVVGDGISIVAAHVLLGSFSSSGAIAICLLSVSASIAYVRRWLASRSRLVAAVTAP